MTDSGGAIATSRSTDAVNSRLRIQAKNVIIYTNSYKEETAK
jgi:hypothetical protein